MPFILDDEFIRLHTFRKHKGMSLPFLSYGFIGTDYLKRIFRNL
jgi:hypothetical protein